MTAEKKKKLIAAVIVAAAEAGVEMDSPYALSNLCEDVLCVHSNSMDFFYGKEGVPIDAVANAKKILGIQ